MLRLLEATVVSRLKVRHEASLCLTLVTIFDRITCNLIWQDGIIILHHETDMLLFSVAATRQWTLRHLLADGARGTLLNEKVTNGGHRVLIQDVIFLMLFLDQ